MYKFSDPLVHLMMENTDPSIIPDPDDIGVIIGEDLGEVEEEEEELEDEEEDEDEDEEEVEEEEDEEDDDDIEVEEPVEED